MGKTNGESFAASLVLLIVDSPSWADEIRAQLMRSGYVLSVVTTEDEARNLLEQQRPDAIVTLTMDAKWHPSHAFGASFDSANRPLQVLVTEQMGAVTADQPADLVLAPSPHHVAYQLHTLLRLRAENLKLRRHLQEVDEEARRLSEQLLVQKRSSNEIEILKNAIVRNVSHELKTPLLQVKSAVSLLSEDPGNTKLIEYAVDATARLESLVKNITLLGGSLDINLGPVIVRDAIEYSRRNLRRIWQHKSDADRIAVVLQENLPPVLADKQGLSTVLQLLMDNALKFSKDVVEVSANQFGDQVCIAVRDRGIGIAREQLGEIFESFYQVDSSSTRRYGGTGVGLAIVRLILDRHGTGIAVDSHQGKGSTFSFLLPAVKL